jgi:hypothetical protein
MAAEFPAAVPTFAAPGANLSTNPHSTMHTKSGEEIVAITTELGTAPKTITDATAAAATPASVAEFLDMVATHLKGIVGGANWYSAIPTTLTALLAKMATTSGAGGHVHDATAGNGPLVPNINGRAVAATLPTDRQVMQWNDANVQWEPLALIEDIRVTIHGNAAPVGTGVQADIQVNYDCIIQEVTVLADQSTTTVLDLWKDTYANFPPLVADTITASAKPTMTAAEKATDATLTGWTKQITAGDIIRVNVDSNDNAERIELILKVARN